MQKQPHETDSWWHERPTKPADFGTAYAPLHSDTKGPGTVWGKTALVIVLMLALVFSLAHMLTR